MSDVLILERVATPRFVGRPWTRAKMIAGRRRNLTELEATAINPAVIAALREASRRLTAQGVRHLVIGALAVGAHGWPRATRDVDLLVAPEAWDTLVDSIGGVDIDYLPVDVAGDFLLASFAAPFVSEDVPIAPMEVVIITKLLRLAMRDQADVVELVKAGVVDLDAVRAYLDTNAPMLTSRFDALVEQARRELGET
ncbi:MAG TPA: hypothetical protein VGH87_26235 [Polyangiaceae bacterium]